MATIINNTGMNNRKIFSIFPSATSGLRANYSTQLLLHQLGFVKTAKVIPRQHFSQKGRKKPCRIVKQIGQGTRLGKAKR
ncbi:hypothetical protein, partial [uncultured Oscillibacter sp.]|uniref:hypothetical protein n=1 Tax=uncultured Oscillibacter sp. TaxID=876091 RepID=UPI00261A052F